MGLVPGTCTSFQAFVLVQAKYKQTEPQLRLLLNHIKPTAVHTANSQPRVLERIVIYSVTTMTQQLPLAIDADESNTFSISQQVFITKWTVAEQGLENPGQSQQLWCELIMRSESALSDPLANR